MNNGNPKEEFDLELGPIEITGLEDWLDDWANEDRGLSKKEQVVNRDVENKQEVVECRHPKKYINRAIPNKPFWVCPECKKDLGDA